MQFTQCYFISMMSQARAASLQPFDALCSCPRMMQAVLAAPPSGQCCREELHGGCRWESLSQSLMMDPVFCLLDQVPYLCPSSPQHGAGADLEAVAVALRCCQDAAMPRTPASKARAIPAAAAAVVISQSLDFSSTDITFPGVAITTGVKSLLTLPCCTNCTISCHCYMPVISFEGLKLLSATSSAPSLPSWA